MSSRRSAGPLAGEPNGPCCALPGWPSGAVEHLVSPPIPLLPSDWPLGVSVDADVIDPIESDPFDSGWWSTAPALICAGATPVTTVVVPTEAGWPDE